MTEDILYGLCDSIIVTHSDPKDAAREFIKDNWTNESPEDLPNSITVYPFKRCKIPINSHIFYYALGNLYEMLDEDYGSAGDNLKYCPPGSHVIEKWKEFKKAVVSDFKTGHCEKCGEGIKVELKPYLDEITKFK